MSWLCYRYDKGYIAYQHLNWSHPEVTKSVTKLIVFSAAINLILFRYIPVNYILLVAGVSLLLANAPFIKAASQTLPQAMKEEFSMRVKYIKDLIRRRNNSVKGEVLLLTVYENQRWWFGVGYMPYLFDNERSAWSDESGVVQLPHKDLYDIDTLQDIHKDVMLDHADSGSDKGIVKGDVWEWLDKEWVIDTHYDGSEGTVSSNSHSVVSHKHHVDSGWVYSDNKWSNASKKQHLIFGSYTRRRKWIRRMIKISSCANKTDSQYSHILSNGVKEE